MRVDDLLDAIKLFFIDDAEQRFAVLAAERATAFKECRAAAELPHDVGGNIGVAL